MGWSSGSGGGGGGDLSVIEEQILGADADAISFVGIPATFRSLLLTFSGETSATINLNVRFNNDGAANYAYHRHDPATQNFAAQSAIAPGIGAANEAVHGEIWVPDYARANWEKGTLSKVVRFAAGTAAPVLYDGGGKWNSLVAINRIDLLTLTVDVFRAGFVATLYGLSA